MITQYLSRLDLYDYRLVCRNFADIAAEELFRVVKFHASQKSVARLQAISEHKNLRACVHAIIWDSNLWNLGEIDSYAEWCEYVASNSGLPSRWDPKPQRWQRPDSRLSTSDELYAQFEKHQVRVAEERALFKDFTWIDDDLPYDGQLTARRLTRTLAKFNNLKKISIVNGHFECRNGRTIKKDFRCGPPDQGEMVSRGERLHTVSKHYREAAVQEFRAALMAAPRRLEKLRVNALHWKALALDEIAASDAWEKYCSSNSLLTTDVALRDNCLSQNLTSLHLTLTCFDDDEDFFWDEDDYLSTLGKEDPYIQKLRDFLRSLTKLQSLHLSLEQRSEDMYFIKDPLAFCTGIVSERTWPSLRKLSLAMFDLSSQQFLDLIISHSSTLEDLRLKDICLYQDPDAEVRKCGFFSEEFLPVSWIEVLDTLQPQLSLKKARCEGLFYSSLKDGGGKFAPRWEMDECGLGTALAEYLVHGGSNPLDLDRVPDFKGYGNDSEGSSDDSEGSSDDFDSADEE